MESILAMLFLAPIIASIPIAFAWFSDPGASWVRKLPYLSVTGLAISLVCSIYIFFYHDATRVMIEWIPALNINFVFIFDYLSTYMGVLTALIAFLIGIYGLQYMKDDYRLGWYWLFFNVFVASMLLVVYSDSLLMMLIGWEGLGLASWGLIGHWFRDDDDLTFVGKKKEKVRSLSMYWGPSDGGWRAISTIRIGDMPMFLAVAAIFMIGGTLNISDIAWGGMLSGIGTAGVLILLLAFMLGPLTKSAQLPFSEWLMTAMTGPTTVSALLHSATMVAAGAYVFMRVSLYMQPWNLQGIPGLETVYLIILFIGLISALYGAVVALGMRERKVLLASSTMSSLGLMFAATAASYWVGEIAIYVAFWYLIIHAFAKATLFLVAGDLIHTTHDRFSNGNLESSKKRKIAFGTTIFATVSLVGIPPLASYWVKSGMDGVMENLAYSVGILPLILLILISLAYAAALAKFLSLNFIKGEAPKQDLHTSEGDKAAAHEEIGFMKIAYAAMAVMLLYILVVFIIGADYHAAEFFADGFLLPSALIGISVTCAYLYTIRNPTNTHTPWLNMTLSNRIYMPFLNDYIIPKAGWTITAWVSRCNKTIDYACHQAVPRLFELVSQSIRRIQVGPLIAYIKIVLGCVMAFLVVASVMWWL